MWTRHRRCASSRICCTNSPGCRGPRSPSNARSSTLVITALARSARVSLDAAAAPVPAYGETGLTSRESEVLGYVVTGRTNAEIAAELVLSEKTISVHISNMLRKTGAANRIELARWARSR
ncbi:helix-turn-helix transcriptional regulator [Paractinoplanes brasiliensis]|uniref:helix-turn-helix transcriptional regulator n=1 Tax=Paractinoplanes brasiliensis TaxID=52695 RepID=UPI0010610E17|nr:LuxR C-terminal-related transcriptional regulator [Actinoplanes brasiliensis]